MYTFADGLLEIEYRKKKMATESERIRWARLTKTTRPWIEKNWSLRRVGLWLGDRVAGLRCELRSQFAAEPSSVTC